MKRPNPGQEPAQALLALILAEGVRSESPEVDPSAPRSPTRRMPGRSQHEWIPLEHESIPLDARAEWLKKGWRSQIHPRRTSTVFIPWVRST